MVALSVTRGGALFIATTVASFGALLNVKI